MMSGGLLDPLYGGQAQMGGLNSASIIGEYKQMSLIMGQYKKMSLAQAMRKAQEQAFGWPTMARDYAEEKVKPPQSFREELQSEIDEWLK